MKKDKQEQTEEKETVNTDYAKNLEETFNELETMYNIDDLENGILENL